MNGMGDACFIPAVGEKPEARSLETLDLGHDQSVMTV